MYTHARRHALHWRPLSRLRSWKTDFGLFFRAQPDERPSLTCRHASQARIASAAGRGGRTRSAGAGPPTAAASAESEVTDHYLRPDGNKAKRACLLRSKVFFCAGEYLAPENGSSNLSTEETALSGRAVDGPGCRRTPGETAGSDRRSNEGRGRACFGPRTALDAVSMATRDFDVQWRPAAAIAARPSCVQVPSQPSLSLLRVAATSSESAILAHRPSRVFITSIHIRVAAATP